jgi:hypothetical protein
MKCFLAYHNQIYHCGEKLKMVQFGEEPDDASVKNFLINYQLNDIDR